MRALSLVAVVLAAVALADAVRSRGRPPEMSASPFGRKGPESSGPEA
ncbi:hypothetical protein [Micromonospora sp. NPDC005299]